MRIIIPLMRSWWQRLELGNGLSFARDSLVPSHMWSVLMCPEPKYEACRRVFTRAIPLLSIIDDIYDVYGTLEEVQLFTDVVERFPIVKLFVDVDCIFFSCTISESICFFFLISDGTLGA